MQTLYSIDVMAAQLGVPTADIERVTASMVRQMSVNEIPIYSFDAVKSALLAAGTIKASFNSDLDEAEIIVADVVETPEEIEARLMRAAYDRMATEVEAAIDSGEEWQAEWALGAIDYLREFAREHNLQ